MLYKVASTVESGDEILECDLSSAAWLAQLGERRSAEREIVGSNPGRTNSQKREDSALRRQCCLCNDICKRLDFLVFSDKDKKTLGSRLTALSLIWFFCDVKEPTPLFQTSRGRTTPVVWPTFPGLGGLSVRRDFYIGITSLFSFRCRNGYL